VGLDRASGGELWFQDNLLTSLEETRLTRYRRDHVAFVFQFYILVPDLTARENVMLVTEIAEHRCRLTKRWTLSGCREGENIFPRNVPEASSKRELWVTGIALSREFNYALGLWCEKTVRTCRP
jgi:putative ABC transport system ATP-binding protein